MDELEQNPQQGQSQTNTGNTQPNPVGGSGSVVPGPAQPKASKPEIVSQPQPQNPPQQTTQNTPPMPHVGIPGGGLEKQEESGAGNVGTTYQGTMVTPLRTYELDAASVLRQKEASVVKIQQAEVKKQEEIKKEPKKNKVKKN